MSFILFYVCIVKQKSVKKVCTSVNRHNYNQINNLHLLIHCIYVSRVFSYKGYNLLHLKRLKHNVALVHFVKPKLAYLIYCLSCVQHFHNTVCFVLHNYRCMCHFLIKALTSVCIWTRVCHR